MYSVADNKKINNNNNNNLHMREPKAIPMELKFCTAALTQTLALASLVQFGLM